MVLEPGVMVTLARLRSTAPPTGVLCGRGSRATDFTRDLDRICQPDVQRCIKAPYGYEQGCSALKKPHHHITLKRAALLLWHAAWQRVAV